MTDDVATQKFTQISRDRWTYSVVSRTRKKYQVSYQILPYGYIREVLTRVDPAELIDRPGELLIWDREIKAGENVTKTWVQHVQGS